MKAALWLLDGTSLPGLKELILALDGASWRAVRATGPTASAPCTWLAPSWCGRG